MSSFTTGQKVRFADSDSKEIFEIVSWDDSSNSGRVEDEHGRGWSRVFGSQLIVVEDVGDGWTDDDDYDDDDYDDDDD
jgi:hypothetical protein